MIILGVEQSRSGGAVVSDGQRLVSWSHVRGDEEARGFPVSAAHRALALAGVGAAAVDLVVVAGRYTPMFLQQRPLLRRLMEAPFSRALDATVALQAMLRHSGIGAFSADAAAQQLHDQLKAEGFGQRRTMSLDVHRALAEIGYRLQPADEALVIVLHPQGDGAALSVHLGRAGQLDRQFVQGGFEALNTHLLRVAVALGLPAGSGVRALRVLAGDAEPEPALLTALRERLHATEGRLSRGLGARAEEAVVALLRANPPAIGAASVLENLKVMILDVVRWYAERHAVGHAVLVGAVFEDARFNGALVRALDLARVTIPPGGGAGMLAFGAAACEAGLAPHMPDLRLGADIDEARADVAIKAAGWRVGPGEGLMHRVERGEAVVRLRGRAAPDAFAMGTRTVLLRPDDPEARARALDALRAPAGSATRLFVRAGGRTRWSQADRVGVCTAFGSAAVEIHAVATEVQEVSAAADPGLHRLLTAAEAKGWPGLLGIPFAEAQGGTPDDEGHAFEIWRRSGLAALQLGSRVLERPS